MTPRDPRRLSDRDLLAALAQANDRSRQATVDFLEHLAEVDERRLYLPQACGSMFTYCVERLHLAEGAAYRRICAARAGRRFPVVFAMLRQGDLHLTAVAKLAPLLTPDNHLQVLERARHQTTRAVERLVAELAPKPDRPDVVRRLDTGRGPEPVATLAATRLPLPVGAAVPGALQVPGVAPSPLAACVPASPSLAWPESSVAPGAQAARIQPTAPGRFAISFTGDQELKDLLDEVRDLLGHQLPRRDLATVFKRGLLSLRADLLRQRAGRTKKPAARPETPALAVTASTRDVASPETTASALTASPPGMAGPDASAPAVTASTPGGAEAAAAKASRHVPNDIRRQVWARDGGRCTFVGEGGERCSETSTLELDHQRPWAQHREHSVEQIKLRCRQHNQWEAVQVYGAAHMARFRRRRQPQRASEGLAPQPTVGRGGTTGDGRAGDEKE